MGKVVRWIHVTTNERSASYPWGGLLDKPERHEEAWGAQLAVLWGQECGSTADSLFISQPTLWPRALCPEDSPAFHGYSADGIMCL